MVKSGFPDDSFPGVPEGVSLSSRKRMNPLAQNFGF
jgi:hypothetical protein